MSLKSKRTLLDNVFSQFIRLSQTDINGYGKCISCGQIKAYNDLDCGHYVNRKHMSLRYSHINCNVQCISCNRFDEGNSAGYSLGLIEKHGIDIIGKLMIAKTQSKKFTEYEFTELINYYRKLNKELASNKNFKINLK